MRDWNRRMQCLVVMVTFNDSRSQERMASAKRGQSRMSGGGGEIPSATRFVLLIVRSCPLREN
jgi:hypothetical protein